MVRFKRRKNGTREVGGGAALNGERKATMKES